VLWVLFSVIQQKDKIVCGGNKKRI
jgi:hypothetical protein